MVYNKSIALLVGSILFGSFVGYGMLYFSADNETSIQDLKTPDPIVDLPVVPLEEEFPHVIPPKSSLFLVLRELEVEPQVIHEVVEASKPVYNLSRMHPGIRFQLKYDSLSGTQLTQIQFRLSALEK